MRHSKAIEHTFYVYWVRRITEWDVWQRAIRSYLFKNPVNWEDQWKD